MFTHTHWVPGQDVRALRAFCDSHVYAFYASKKGLAFSIPCWLLWLQTQLSYSFVNEQITELTNILHRDLKPGNLLVNANCDLKICDFGLARTSRGNEQFMTEYVVTRWYRAPELLLCCDNYGTSIDVWSVGCIFAEILGRKPIFPGTECLNQLKLIISVLGSQNDTDLEFIDSPKARRYIKTLPYTRGTHLSHLYPHADPLALDLLQRMLVFDPSKRITVTEALLHPYISGLYDPIRDPLAQVPINLDIDENLGGHIIREMIWDEILHYHPEAV
ncbi:MITOGEN-ACTIVATED PROTEIN KINASE [Salix koriyanagi]|uniref:mitogen-activated protein kinase n=1 Tax=Salix koriyanagi TaxID=2511006 RepID=A0A9Q0P6H0_9ROSI|nr:MITOGEN-ACTIVATED PROTEIN KINASE [Salix koriyanagi]